MCPMLFLWIPTSTFWFLTLSLWLVACFHHFSNISIVVLCFSYDFVWFSYDFLWLSLWIPLVFIWCLVFFTWILMGFNWFPMRSCFHMIPYTFLVNSCFSNDVQCFLMNSCLRYDFLYFPYGCVLCVFIVLLNLSFDFLCFQMISWGVHIISCGCPYEFLRLS